MGNNNDLTGFFQSNFAQANIPDPDVQRWDQGTAKGSSDSALLEELDILKRDLLIGDWCREGDLGFIFAFRGLGKTWFSMEIARGLALGEKIGDWDTYSQSQVWYLDGEMPAYDLQLRNRQLGIFTKKLEYLNHELLWERTGLVMNLANSAFQEAILKRCNANSINVLILDNLSCLVSGVDENKAIEWEILTPWLMELRRARVTVIFIHHAGRNRQMRGHSKREDPCAWVIRLDDPPKERANAGAHFIARFTKWRNAERMPRPTEWIFLHVAEGRVRPTVYPATNMDLMLDLIANGLDTCSSLAQELDVSPGMISRLAKEAEADGAIKITNRRYSILE